LVEWTAHDCVDEKQKESGIFSRQGLDTVSRFETAGEIRFCAHVVLGVWEGCEGAAARQIA
jgi:hypothetical protein